MLVRLAVPLLALLTVPGIAQECPERDTIVALSDIVLAKRGELPRLQARNFGAQAAYLKLRYEGLDETAAEALLRDPELAGARHFTDLVFAWSVTHDGLAATAERLGAAEMQAALLASATTVRALLAFDAPDVVVNAIAALPDERAAVAIAPIYTALLDLPEATRREVADLALRKGEVALAAAVAATLPDRTLWYTVLFGLADPEQAAALTRMYGVLPTFVGLPPILSDRASDPAAWAKIYEVVGAGALLPEMDFLNTFLNQTGRIDEAQVAAAAVRDAFANGTLARHGPLDAGWLHAYRALREALADDAMLDAMLASSPVSGRAARPQLADVIEWIIALEALGPYLRGETDHAPEAPEGPYGAVRDWDGWIALADTARLAPLGMDPTADGTQLARSAEVLFAAGQDEALVRLLDAAPASLTGLSLAEDLAERYDRGCAAYTWHIAESMTLAGTPIFKFDALGVPAAAEAEAEGAKLGR